MSEAIIVAAITAATTIVTAVIAVIGALLARKLDSVHLLINSRMDELLRLAASAARAEGVAAGEQSQRDRSAPSDS